MYDLPVIRARLQILLLSAYGLTVAYIRPQGLSIQLHVHMVVPARLSILPTWLHGLTVVIDGTLLGHLFIILDIHASCNIRSLSNSASVGGNQTL